MKILEIVKAIKQGKVLILPTDTVYGLVCDAANKKAVDKIFKIKKRPKSKPLPVFVSDIKMAKKLAIIDKKQEKFLKSVWPGAVTAILKSRQQKNKTIGLRIPNYRPLLDLVKQLNRPLAETSANISGKPAPGNIKEILKQFNGQKHQPDLIVRHRMSNKAKPSKVIDLTVWPPKILRP